MGMNQRQDGNYRKKSQQWIWESRNWGNRVRGPEDVF